MQVQPLQPFYSPIAQPVERLTVNQNVRGSSPRRGAIFLKVIMKPLGNKILVERIAGTKQTTSGIILQRTDEPDRAKILAIGPDVDEVAVGEVALLNWNAAIKTGIPDQYVLSIEHVVFIYE